MPITSKEILQEKLENRQRFAKRLRHAKSIRRLKNKDIVDLANKLGIPMSLSTVSQSMTGRLTPTRKRLRDWALILRVNPYWLSGIGSDEEIMDFPTDEEVQKNLEELSKLFMKLNPERQKLILKLTKELAYSFENPIDIITVAELVDKRSARRRDFVTDDSTDN